MPCYHPLHGHRSEVVNETGKRSIVFGPSLSGEVVSVPCGRCIGCRLELSRQWALRCVHEAQLHADNSFVTLTYDDAHLPYGGTLIKNDFRRFIKRLRKNLKPHEDFKYYHCGEYGGRYRRPHYHALLFGCAFMDQKLFTRSSDGSGIYTSEILSSLWPAGFSTTGDVTFESAAYVARYTCDKLEDIKGIGKALNCGKERQYEYINIETGEVTPVVAEYTTMSLKPAIAKNWYKKFSGDAYPSDFLILRGKKMKPPKYYDRLHEIDDAIGMEKIKAARIKQAASRTGGPHLAAEEEYVQQRLKQLKRNLG